MHVFSALYSYKKEDKEVRVKAELGLVCASSWKANLVVLGYADGTICVVNTNSKKTISKQTQFGKILSIKFAPGKGKKGHNFNAFLGVERIL